MKLKHILLIATCLAWPMHASAQGGVAAPRPITPVTQPDLDRPIGDEWLTYHGDYSGDHFSALSQINTGNVVRLERVWTSVQDAPVAVGRRAPAPAAAAPPAAAVPAAGPARPTPDPAAAALPPGVFPGMFIGATTPPGAPGTPEGGSEPLTLGVPATFGAQAMPLPQRPNTATGGIRSAPLVRSGVIYYTSGANAYALDARTGKQIWHYVGVSSGGISNRGLAIAGDTLFMMANGGLTALNAATGAELWRKTADGPVPASAPVVVRNHVIFGMGADGGGVRSWLESRDAQSGEVQWKWFATPSAGEEGIETWPDIQAAARGAGTPWQPLSYDRDLNLLYIGTGNPAPTKDGRSRSGDNLWTSSIVAINPDTGKMAWFFQMTPHDDHDYDGNQTIMLFDAPVSGKTRKLLGMVGRNGYMFVVDRTSGQNVYTKPIFDTLNWAFPTLRANGTPEPNPAKSPSRGGTLVNPSSEGATNYPAASYSPKTGLIYAYTVNSWSIFYNGGETWFGDFRSSLKAWNAATGKLAWEHKYPEPYGIQARYPGLLTTAGGVLFTGDVSGNVVAFDAKTGKPLWHDPLPGFPVTNAPQTYSLDGRQYILLASGEHLYAYALK